MKTQNYHIVQFGRFATVMLLTLLLNACASSRYTILEPAKEPLTNFEVLEIKDFTSNLSDEDSVNLASRFANQLHLAIQEEVIHNT